MRTEARGLMSPPSPEVEIEVEVEVEVEPSTPLASRPENGDAGSMRTTFSALAVAAALLSCGGGAPPAPVAPAPTAKPPSEAAAEKKSSSDDAAAKNAAIDAFTSDEVKKGTCDPSHKEALEKLLVDVESGMKTKTGDDGKPLGMQMVGKRVVGLGPTPRAVEMNVTGRGAELHVVAYSVREVSLDVLQGTAPATTMRSPFQRNPTTSPLQIDLPKIGPVNDVQSDSRQIQIKPGQPLQVRLTGQGCAAFALFLKP